MRRNVVTILFLLVSLFIYYVVVSLRKNHSFHSYVEQVEQPLALDLSYFHQVSLEKYPVQSCNLPISIVVVPSGNDLQAHYLTSAVYQTISKDLVKHVIVIIQSDDYLFHGAALPTQDMAKKLSIDRVFHAAFVKQLSQHALFHYYDAAYHPSKKFELQLAYMRYYLNSNILITPIMIGQLTENNAAHIAAQIADIADEHTLIVLSLTLKNNQKSIMQNHFHNESLLEMYALDTTVMQAIQGIPAGNTDCNSGVLYGKYGYILLLKLLEQAQFKNSTSYFVGYALPEKSLVMESYAAFIYKKNEEKGYENYIGCYEQQQMIDIAYDALHELFEPSRVKNPHMISYEMTQPHGAFVSLYAMSDHGTLLRGCMGVMACQEPLSEIIVQMAEQAATIDHRFYAIKHQEVKSTMISISLITDFVQVTDFTKINQSQGILFEYGDSNAVTFGSKDFHDTWTYQHALTDLCFQSNVPAESWQQPNAKIFTFNSTAFQ